MFPTAKVTIPTEAAHVFASQEAVVAWVQAARASGVKVYNTKPKFWMGFGPVPVSVVFEADGSSKQAYAFVVGMAAQMGMVAQAA
jgi:hypothetical protein